MPALACGVERVGHGKSSEVRGFLVIHVMKWGSEIEMVPEEKNTN